MSALEKYCAGYAEPEIRLLKDFAIGVHDNVLIVPAYRESPEFFYGFHQSLLYRQSVLLVLVINQPDNDLEKGPNQALFESISAELSDPAEQGNLTYGCLPNCQSGVLLVDRFSEHPLPPKEAVGLARKIGNDIAAELIRLKLVRYPVLFNTDADTQLPENYFAAITDSSRPNSACIYPFEHDCDDSVLGLATQLYELRLQHYVDGLQRAGSDFAFHTIGSTLAIDVNAYAMVRGFPKRAAGEDFYMLNKLAKVAPIIALDRPTLVIAARISDRVPFGTGPAVKQLLGCQDPWEEALFYHPSTFAELGRSLKALTHCPQSFETLREQGLSEPSLDALERINIASFFNRLSAQHRKEPTHPAAWQQFYARRLGDWFDAFKTLKFIHNLRDGYYPNINYQQLILLNQQAR
jgi:hypothetical protein